METAPLPIDEQKRLAELRQYGILDTGQDMAFEHMARLASFICQTPIAAIGFVDETRLWLKAITGLDIRDIPRDIAFCAHTILQDGTMVVADVRADKRFQGNPLVTSAPNIQFYAGVPLTTPQGFKLGTLCVLDRVPRQLSTEQLEAVNTIAEIAMAHLDLHLSSAKFSKHAEEMRLAATIFESTSESMLITDAKNRIITVNPAFTSTTGYARDEVIGRDPKLLASGKHDETFYRTMWQTLEDEGRWNGEIWNLRKSGDLFAEYLSINTVRDDSGNRYMHVGIFSDITEKKQADERIWRQANFDYLTQLPNRRLFGDRLEQQIRDARRTDEALALLYIDLDHFKEVNDTHGHGIGDKLLVEAARRIRGCVRETDTVARMGGDEFTVILSHLAETGDAEKVSANILPALAEPFVFDSIRIVIAASIGITLFPQHADTPDDLLRHADRAMYKAKNGGRGRFSYSS